MREQKVSVNNSLGLHSHAAMDFIQKAGEFHSKIWVKNERFVVNAKSLLGVLSLNVEKGHDITIMAEGPDMDEAVDALAELIAATNEIDP